MTATVMIQSCCQMPPYATSLSQSLVTPRSHLRSKKAQAASNLFEGEKNIPEFHAIPKLTAQTSAVSVFGQVPPATMAKVQHKDSVLGLVIPYICKGVKLKG